MKRIKLLFFSLIMLFALPLITKAFTSLEISTPNPVVGDNFYLQLNINYMPSNGKDPKIRDFHVYIEYDPDAFEYVGTYWLQGQNRSDSSELGRIYLDKDDNGQFWSAQISPVNLEFRALKKGISEIKVKRNGESHYKNGDIISQSLSNVTVNSVSPSTNTLIGTLGVEGYLMEPTFRKEHTKYSVTVPADVTSVKVIATSIDKKQTIEGTGKIYLEYGDNEHLVRVKAQNGDYRDYTILIHRIDDRTGDTSLKSVNISDTNIRIKKGVTEYSATVGRSVDSVLIAARTTDPKATLVGTGRKNLQIGKNTFEVVITSSKNTKTVYTFVITRSTEELERVVLSSKLKTLRANNLSLDLSNDKRIFATGVKKDDTSISINAAGESQTATIEITGNNNLKYGLNAVNIKVSELMEEATDDEEAVYDITEYKVAVYRNPEDSVTIDDIKRPEVNGNPLYVTGPNASHIVPASTMRYLINNNKALYYNVVNIYNGILYQVKLKDNLPDSDFDVSFTQTDQGFPTYETNLPKGTNLLLYLGDYYEDETNVKIYSFEDDGKYELVTDGITIQDGYIEFVLNGSKNYTITTAQLVKERGVIEEFFHKNGTLIGAIAFIIVIALGYLIILNRYKDRKAANEPSY